MAGFGSGKFGSSPFGSFQIEGEPVLEETVTIHVVLTVEGPNEDRVPGWGAQPWGGAVGAITAAVGETLTVSEGLVVLPEVESPELFPAQTSGGYGGVFGTSWGGQYLYVEGDADVFETVSLSEAVAIDFPLAVVGATPLTSYAVRVRFSQPLDPGWAPNFDPANYALSPGLTVNAVLPGLSPNAVILVTDEQAPTLYVLTVSNARSLSDPLGPDDTATFLGFPIAPSFIAAVQSKTKLAVWFSVPMQVDSEFTDIGNYRVTDLKGNILVVGEVTTSGPSPVRRVEITLQDGYEFSPLDYYSVTVEPAVVSTQGASVTPPSRVVQWREHLWAAKGVGPISIPIASFSGEVSGGLLGQPAGQIFFSPALEQAIANSTLEVDEVSLCTRAYDVYTIPPQVPDPVPLRTWDGTAATHLVGGTNVGVLYAPAERMGEARLDLSDLREETMPQAVDGPADGVLVEPIDILKGGFLNDARWGLADGVLPDPSGGTYPAAFHTIDNLTPVGAGPTTNISLQP